MCGIAGILTFDHSSLAQGFDVHLQRMVQRMALRGPDDEGVWLDPRGRLGLGFRRLAVLDLTPAGHQPMLSPGGRSVLVMNGEIYNYPELKLELESKGRVFRSRSDAEVLQAALEMWGEDALPRLNGMFAFAWYDTVEQCLLLARDHAGIKPLYYLLEPTGKGLVFASQYNQLLLSPWGTPGEVQLDVLNLYLRLHHIPSPFGLLKNTFQLEPGHYIKVNGSGTMVKRSWWSLPRSPHPDLSGEAAVELTAKALASAVQRQRAADVPLGVFLSGGVDSPLVAAVARSQTAGSLKAFTIGNPGWGQDEAADAERYAQALEVDFHLQNVSGEQALDLIPQVWAAQYEPFADFSILPTMLISRFARQELTVALSGDGGDELFFGYERPRSLLRNGADFRYPWAVRRGLYAAGRLGWLPARSEVIAARSPGEYYFNVNCRLSTAQINRMAPELPGLPVDFELYHFDRYRDVEDLAHFSRYVEFNGQLQRGLKKMDMASMHFNLEVRVPLLDREVIEASLRIHPETHMQGGQRKQVLFRLLGTHVPEHIIPRGKRGFAVPLGDWLRGPLKPVVEEMLLGGALYPHGLFHKEAVRAYWQEHLEGKSDHKWGLWTLMALQGWAKENL